MPELSGGLVVPALLVALAAWAPAVAHADDAPAAPAAEPAVRGVDVGGGRKLTLLTQGTGGPTVVIEAGLAAAPVESGEWKAVCDEIAKTNLVCVYNRAGLGASDPAPQSPRTAQNLARDLHALLTGAEVPGPYVLVGHSVGGLAVRVFADLYPDDVAAVVLVDASHPDQERRWLAALGAKRRGEDAAVSRARDFLNNRLAKPAENPEKLDVVASAKQARAARPLGDKPLAVLTHSRNWKMVPDLPDAVSRRLEDVTQDLQKQTTKLSTNATHRVAGRGGHALHQDEPEVVVAAIRETVEKVKSGPAR